MEHHFGLHRGHLDEERLKSILDEHGAWHVNYTEPRGEKRGWFCCRNRGEPFNSNTERDVLSAINEAGGLTSFSVNT